MAVFERSLRTLCAFALSMAAYAYPARADIVSPRVRPVGHRVASLLARGRAASQTLAVLVHQLEHTDVIVHIEEHWLLDGRHVGETLFVTAAGGHRYLRIHLDPRIHDEAAIAVLGHELQHALEIADARWVVNEATLGQLYAQIGYQSKGGPGWYGVDTSRAREAARVVLRELRRNELTSTD